MSKNPRRGSNQAAYTDEQIIRDIELANVIEPGGVRGAWDESDAFGRNWLVERAALKMFLVCENYSQRALRLRAWLLDHPDPDPGEITG